jgi:hypothetical protein
MQSYRSKAESLGRSDAKQQQEHENDQEDTGYRRPGAIHPDLNRLRRKRSRTSNDHQPCDVPGGVVAVPTGLSADEAAGLKFMREEEKLAHDVYVTLGDTWGLRVFDNIAAAEQQHTDAVAYWLNYYHVNDPAVGNAVGKFTDPALQTLYDKLVAQGKQSLADALKVGAAIEEIDITDLQERMAATTNATLDRLYGNLEAGSENHLRAFATNLKNQTGQTYAPQSLSVAAYNEIVSASSRAAGNGGRGRRP